MKKNNNKNIKHKMLRLAKSIAEMPAENEIRRNEVIEKTLKQNKEFDSSEFKEMVREAQRKLKNKAIEASFPEDELI